MAVETAGVVIGARSRGPWQQKSAYPPLELLDQLQQLGQLLCHLGTEVGRLVCKVGIAPGDFGELIDLAADVFQNIGLLFNGPGRSEEHTSELQSRPHL